MSVHCHLAGRAEDVVIVLCWASLLGDTTVAQQCLVPLLASHGMRATWHGFCVAEDF